MSADINIIQDEDKGVEIIVRVNNLQLQIHEFYGKYASFNFDLTNRDHRQAIKNIVEVFQSQLYLHGEQDA
jgi:hypothetical protein